MPFKSRGYVGIAALAVLAGAAAAAYLFWPARLHTPAPLESYNASLEKGRYLATVGNCAACHTAEDGQPYAGGLAFKTDFGTLYSTNITMDEKTGIGGWSFEDFYQSMKHGVRPDGTHLYPAFPYTSFAKLTDEDIASLYLYMRTVTPVSASNRPNAMDFPFNMRALLQAWKKLFHTPQTFQPNPTQSVVWNRGAYLVEGPAHCGACHTPRNILGAERKDWALTGGVYYDEVKTGAFRKWSAVNLTPASSGLKTWSHQDIVHYLKLGQNSHAVVHGPMNEVVINSTRYLTDTDAAAIATYLKALPAKAQGGGPMPSKKTLAAGEIAYTVHCGTCHLPSGEGDSILGVPLTGNPIVQAEDPSSFINVVLYGPHLPPPPFSTNRTRMKAFGKRLSDEDIANLTTYVRSNFGNQAGAVTPEQVKEQR